MARTGRSLLAWAVAGSMAIGLNTGIANAAPPSPRHATGSGVREIPSGAPPAATWPEPTLPKPKGWPFAEAFPRTSGTGRLAGGASFWSDFVYDDHGASAGQPSDYTSYLAPARGAYQYPDGPASGNGADIFRAAVGLTDQATYWRVDWNTLVDPRVPIAEWTFDSDGNARTGATAWPAASRVDSPGIEQALVVSGRGAWLVDAASGKRIAIGSVGGSLTVDTRSRSFVVRVPRSALPVRRAWRIRLAAGLADETGTAFAPVPTNRGGAPGAAAVYNVTFRSYLQEPVVDIPDGYPAVLMGPRRPSFQFANLWMEIAQSASLFRGDVSAYSLEVRWDRLAARAETPEPLPRGYTNRWYVSRLNLGQGVVKNASDEQTGDLRPNYLGRVQPYSVYVPTHYNPTRAAPFTWILHSLGLNHNQYGGVAPDQLLHECERRNSICATPLGFGPDGWYLDEAEVDFWQVWRAVADAYTLDPNRTVISGYSMGGWGTNWLASRYPDLFAKAMEMAGPSSCSGIRLLGPVQGSSVETGHCATAGDVLPILENVRWVPFIMVHGALDELVPITGVIQEMLALDRLAYRYYALLYPAEGHTTLSVKNGWSTATAQIGDPSRIINPGHITYSWYPELRNPSYGIGPTGVYWIGGLRARQSGPGVLARVDAISEAKPDPPVQPFRRTTAKVAGSPSPAIVRQLTWSVGYAAKSRPEMVLSLTNVAALTLDAERAGLRSGTISLVSDGPVALTLRNLAPGTIVRVQGRTMARANGDGIAVVSVRPGRTVLSLA